MTKEKFIEFIQYLGFSQTWLSKPDVYSLSTDVVSQPNKNLMSFANQLNIHFDDKHGLVQLSLSSMTSHMMSGKNFGNFQLKTFGEDDDLQIQIFMSFVKGAFKNPPTNITQYMRDKKIEDILK